MKKNTILSITFIGLFAVLLLFTGCDPNAMTKDQVLDEFISAANSGNWDKMYTYIHPDNPDRNSYKSGATFSGLFSTETPMSYSIDSTNGDTYEVDMNYQLLADQTETYKFRADGEGLFSQNFLILSFEVGSTTY